MISLHEFGPSGRSSWIAELSSQGTALCHSRKVKGGSDSFNWVHSERCTKPFIKKTLPPAPSPSCQRFVAFLKSSSFAAPLSYLIDFFFIAFYVRDTVLAASRVTRTCTPCPSCWPLGCVHRASAMHAACSASSKRHR